MGFFSWITQDTNRSIPSSYSCRDTFPVYMTDSDGNVYAEEAYEGYGVFGGKDYYQLVAEMNQAEGLNGDVENDRILGIRIALGIPSIKNVNTGEVLSYPDDFPNWGEPIRDGLCANDLADTDEWERIDLQPDVVYYPSLTEDPLSGWLNEQPEDCPEQGFFYEDDDDDEYYDEDVYYDEDEDVEVDDY